MKTYAKLMRMAMCLFIAAVLAVSGVSPSVAGTIYVNQYSAVPGTGSSWGNAFTNLQSALAAAAAGDQVWVAQGIYYPGTNLTDSFLLKPDVGLYGGFAGVETSLSQRKWQKYVTTLSADIGIAGNAADNINRVVTAQSATNAALDGFYISGGYGSTSLPLYNSGAGLKISGSPLAVTNCCFESNNAQEGGAVWSEAPASFRDCIFKGNSSRSSGGAVKAFFDTTLDNCVFSDNTAPAGAGGAIIFSNVYTLAINNCTFASNSARNGGYSVAVINRGTALVRNSIFWNAGHATRDAGGGIWVVDVGDPGVDATLVDVRYSDIKGGFTATNHFFATNNINQDPLFVDQASRDLHIQSGSPCVDMADPANVLTPDFDGVVRPTGTGVDMGAYEYTAESPGVVAPVAGLSGAGDYAKINLQWSNAASTNFRGVLVLYYPTNIVPVGVPADGSAYQAGQMVGNQKVGYCGPGDDAAPAALSGAVYSNLPPMTTFTSAVYAYDHETNYSVAVRTAATTYTVPSGIEAISAEGGAGQIEIVWDTVTDPSRGVLMLRHRDSAPTNTPVHTQVYQAGDMIGDDVVAYVGPGAENVEMMTSSWTNTGLAGSATYYYHVFVYDDGPNYSDPKEVFADTFSMQNITNAVDISLDHYFRFTWTNPNEPDMQGFLILRGDAGFATEGTVNGTVYNTGDVIGGSTVVFRGAVSNITPNAVSGWQDSQWFSAQTTRYYTFYAYDGVDQYARPVMEVMATTTADTNKPGPVTGLTGTPSLGYNTLNWTNPPDVDFRGLLVVRDTEPITWLPTAGASYQPGSSVGSVYVVYIGPGNNIDANGAIPGVANDTVDNQGIQDGVRYYYRVCSIDEDQNYSTPADTSVQVPSASKIYVNDDAAGSNNGTTWENAFTNLQSAITNWIEGKQIWVAEGVYVPGTNRADQFTLKVNMAVYGGFAGNEGFLIHRKWTNNPSILEGDIGVKGDSSDNIQQIVRVPAAATGSLLDGFTIENAYGSTVGAGIWIGAAMLVQNCIIQTNSGSTGGMHTDYVKATVRNTIFRGNHGTYRGGALQVYGGWGQNPVFENCLFYDNTQATVGGAMSVYHGPSTFRNCAFINNYAPDGSCAYLSNFGEPHFYNCILWDSGAHGNGIWIKKWNEYNEAGQSSFNNCLMREDMSPPDPPHFGSSYVGDKLNCIIGSDPLFVSEAGKDFRLQDTSPGIDTADTANSPTDDLDGNLRPGGLASDIGPYEITGGRPLPPGILFMLK
jgi:hypothetical protein